MKIWCCPCFTVEDEPEEEEGKEAMKEGDFVNKVNSEGVMANEEEEEEVVPRLELAASDGGGRDRDRDRDDHLRMFEGMVQAMRSGTHWDESVCVGALDTLRAAIRSPRWSEGETSSAPVAAAAEEEDGDHDSHHKRAKVHSFSHDFHYAMAMSSGAGDSSSSDRDYSRTQGSNVLYKSETFFHSFTPNIGGEENPYESGSGKDDERDKGDTSTTEDFEVRMDLTDDLLHMVFSFLDHINLCRAAIVCRQWRAASAHEDFWRCLNFENRNISVEQFEDICLRYPNATELNISGTPAIPLLVMTAIRSLRNLEVLTLGKGTIGDLFFHSLADCQMLKSLIVNDATLGTGIQEIPINHDRLRHLELTKCRVMRISIRCPQLETLSMKRSNMAQAVLNSPLLRDLDLGSCHKLSDAAIRSAATSCPQLESLDMSNCSCVSDETLREIALTCANLHVLNASYCPNVSLESVRLPMLTVLKLHSCEGITSASMVAISNSYMLEVLELDNCSLLTSVILDLPRLQNIRLVHCRKFADLNLRTLMLSSIMVSNCPVLHRISITSNSLQKLSLQKQESLTTLALQCPSLQEVDLTDCESLTNSICNVFSDGGGCPMLKTLVLENCESLTAVRFCSTSLVSLSLVGCRGITSLELTCPYLEQVSLDGCDHLESAAFFPVGLRSLNLGICPKLNALSIDAPNMVLLELKGCGVLSEASINCPLLTSLDASFCSQLRDDCLSATAASCPLIESLILMSCPSVGSDGLYSLRWLPNLIVLDLSYTFLMSLKPVFESCIKLKVLKLQACKYLSDSSLEPLYKEGALPALQELDLSYGTLCQSAIEELLSFCTQLTHVSLNGCVNMHDLNWGSSGGQPLVKSSISVPSLEYVHEPVEYGNRLLQNLNCVGCPNIRKVHIPVAAGCFHLTSLNLSLSANLKDVEVACFNLCFLNLSNCYSLEVLKLDCPKLTSLFLQSCNMDEAAVEAAISKCSMLETLDVRFCPKICPLSMGRLRAACPSLKRIFSSLSPQS
ncbi:F-box/LRR-repeat protein 15 [Rosa sericea]